MSQTAYILAGISYYVISIIIIVTVLNWLNNREKKKYQDEITTLERDKNLIISSSILSELNKVEALVNNEKLQESYEDWKLRFKEIKEVEVPKITDALIEIEDCLITEEWNKTLINAVNNYIETSKTSVYNEATKNGILKKYSYLNYNWNIISFTDKHLLILKEFLNKNYNINSNIIKTKKGHFLLEINKKNTFVATFFVAFIGVFLIFF